MQLWAAAVDARQACIRVQDILHVYADAGGRVCCAKAAAMLLLHALHVKPVP
jgi:hypothetical protein